MSQNIRDSLPGTLDNDFHLPAPACRQWPGRSCRPSVHAMLTSKQNCMFKEERSLGSLAFDLSVKSLVSAEEKPVLQTMYAQIDPKG